SFADTLTSANPVDLKLDAAGNLYYLARNEGGSGEIYRISALARTIDDGDVGFAVTGAWPTSTLGGFQGDSRYNTAGTGADSATWTFTVSPGQYRVSATWPAGSNRASNSPFTVLDGATPLGTVALNQRVAPNDFTASGANWEDVGTFTLTGTTLVVRLSDATNHVCSPVAVQFGLPSPAGQIVDDGDAGCAAVAGAWPTSTLRSFHA